MDKNTDLKWMVMLSLLYLLGHLNDVINKTLLNLKHKIIFLISKVCLLSFEIIFLLLHQQQIQTCLFLSSLHRA